MIILYVFIYGKKKHFTSSSETSILLILDVARNLEKRSQENARKMSSLVGMAGKKSFFFFKKKNSMVFFFF